MFCSNCGKENPDDAAFCFECGRTLKGERREIRDYGVAEKPPSYLVQAILVTLFCCLPFGVVSIVYAAQVDSKFAAGDHRGAWETSEKAKMWSWLSFGIGLAIGAIYLVIGVLGAGASV